MQHPALTNGHHKMNQTTVMLKLAVIIICFHILTYLLSYPALQHFGYYVQVQILFSHFAQQNKFGIVSLFSGLPTETTHGRSLLLVRQVLVQETNNLL